MAFNCTLCGMGPRATIVLVAILSLIFSAGYVLFTTAGILAHNCDLNMTNSHEEYAIYLYYLRSSECGKINLTYLGINHVPAEVQIEVPDVSAAAERTYIFCIIGVILYGLWFITSLLLLGSACASCMGRCCIAVGIYPFVITIFLVLAFDVVTFVFYLIDFIGSFDVDFVLNLLEIGNQDEARLLFDQIDDIYLVVPPLIFWLTASKGVIIWFLFFVLAFVMLGVSSRLWEENKPAPRYSSAVQAPRTIEPVASAPTAESPNNNIGLTVAATRYNDPARQPNDDLVRGEVPPANNANVRRTVEPLKGGHEQPLPNQEPLEDRDIYPEELPVKQVPYNMYDKRFTYLPQAQNIHNDEQPPTPRTSMNPAPFNPYDKRFSYTPGNPQPFSYLAGPPQQQLNPRNSSNSPEVRSQLPWSYFRNSEELAMPRRVTSTLSQNKEFPGEEISPPMAKPSAPDDRSSDEGKWSGPEYRY